MPPSTGPRTRLSNAGSAGSTLIAAGTGALVTLGFVDRVAGVVLLGVVDELLRVFGEEVAFGAHQHIVVEGELERVDLDVATAVLLGGNVSPLVLAEGRIHRGRTHQHQYLTLGHAGLQLIHGLLVEQVEEWKVELVVSDELMGAVVAASLYLAQVNRT